MEIKEIISLTKHCLHLCNSSNIEETIFSYLGDADAFITNDVQKWRQKFDENKIKCPIKKPDRVKKDESVVVDSSSLGKDFKKLEKKLEKQNKAVCIYNIEDLEPIILKDLVAFHDKMFLSVNKIKMISDKNLEKEMGSLNAEIVESLVKKELKNIILSLLLSKPMCGTDLVKILYEKFRVFISPGMLYPTLCELEKKGMLKYEYKLKNKIYSIQKKEQVKNLLDKHAKVNSLLSQFLVCDIHVK